MVTQGRREDALPLLWRLRVARRIACADMVYAHLLSMFPALQRCVGKNLAWTA